MFPRSAQAIDAMLKLRASKDVAYPLTRLQELAPDVYAHAVRVTGIAMDIGLVAGLTEPQLQKLGFACLLHDLGKLDLESELLRKQGLLSKPERRRLQEHVRRGFLRIHDPEVAAIVAAHHEFQKGPYPCAVQGRRKKGRLGERRLPNSEISWIAQLLALADMTDALSHPRLGKLVLPPGKIRAHLERQFTGDRAAMWYVLTRIAETRAVKSM